MNGKTARSRREWILWVVFVVGLLGVIVVGVLRDLGPHARTLDRYGPVPAFDLTTQDGSSRSNLQLQGTVWLADFMFTRCGGLCPLLTARMRSLAEALDGETGWHLISFSVDPEYDTPAVLTAYAAAQGADTTHWTFLTGDKATVRNLCIQGFHLAVDEGADNAVEPILHSQSIVLVDARGEIRGYYDSQDEEESRQLLEDVRLLLSGGGD